MDIECSKCGVSKAREAFRKYRRSCKECESAACKEWHAKHPEYAEQWHKNNPDSRRKWKEANPEKDKELRKRCTLKWREENKDRVKTTMRLWRDAHPEKDKLYRERYPDRVKAIQKRYLDKNPGRSKRYRDKHPERVKQYEARWATKHPEKVRELARRRRARKKGAEGTHTKAEWIALVESFGGYCLCCRKYFGLRKLTEDHVIPLDLGGSDYLHNVQPLCFSCNARKGNRHTTDYRKNWEPAEAGPRS